MSSILPGERSAIDLAARHLRNEGLRLSGEIPSIAGELFLLTGGEGLAYVASLRRDLRRHGDHALYSLAARALERIEARIERAETDRTTA